MAADEIREYTQYITKADVELTHVSRYNVPSDEHFRTQEVVVGTSYGGILGMC